MLLRFRHRVSTEPRRFAPSATSWLAVAVSTACAAGCVSAATARATALEDADVVERELDTLFSCSEEATVDEGLEIARSDARARVLQTGWEADGSDRRRLTVFVRLHTRFGPGVDAVVTRDRWVGEGSGDLEGPTAPAGTAPDTGWTRVPGTDADGAIAGAVTAATADCWRAESPLAN